MNQLRPVSLQEVADASEVSVSTASRILQGLSKGRGNAAKRVKEAARALGYRPNVLMSALASRRFQLDRHEAGLPLAMLTWPRRRSLERMLERHYYRGFEISARSRGYAPQLLALREKESLPKVIQQLRARGVAGIALSDLPPDQRPFHAVDWSAFSLVLLDQALPSLGCVQIRPDIFGNVLLAYKQLAARGCRRIGAVFGRHEGGHPEDALREAVAHYWAAQRPGGPPPLLYQMPGAVPVAQIARWVKSHRVDGVVCFPGTVQQALRDSGRGSLGRIDSACTSVGEKSSFAGILERHPDLGSLACDHLDGLIHRRTQGPTKEPMRLTLLGHWHPGIPPL